MIFVSFPDETISTRYARVLGVTTLSRAVAFEVVDEHVGPFTDVAEVHSLSTLAEEQKPIEYLEELRRRLVNRAHDRLTAIGELAEEARNRPCALGVKAGRRLVKEDERRLRNKLDGDGGALPVLNAERADDSVAIGFKTTHLQDSLDAA